MLNSNYLFLIKKYFGFGFCLFLLGSPNENKQTVVTIGKAMITDDTPIPKFNSNLNL